MGLWKWLDRLVLGEPRKEHIMAGSDLRKDVAPELIDPAADMVSIGENDGTEPKSHPMGEARTGKHGEMIVCKGCKFHAACRVFNLDPRELERIVYEMDYQDWLKKMGKTAVHVKNVK